MKKSIILLLMYSFSVDALVCQKDLVKLQIEYLVNQIQSYHDGCQFKDYGEQGYCEQTWYGFPSAYPDPENPNAFFTCRTYCHYYNPPTTFDDVGGSITIPTCLRDAENLKFSSEDLQNLFPRCKAGSIIQVTNQTLGEFIPLTGSHFGLSYFSDRVLGKKDLYKINFPIVDSDPDSNIQNYYLKIFKGTNEILTQEFANTPNQNYIYSWNGVDDSVETWGSVLRKFTLTINYSNQIIPYVSKEYSVGSFKARKLGLGGWVPSIWHFYDPLSKKLFLGNGKKKDAEAILEGGLYRIADETGLEVYYFDNIGRIVQTKTGLTGSVLYTFLYDSAGQLSAIQEPFNKTTVFKRYLSGKLKAIVTPHNKKTSIVINNQGYLTKTISPNNESYEMSYDGTGGLLLSFKKPNGSVSAMTYNSDGNLILDSHSSGFSTALSNSTDGIIGTSALGRISVNRFDSNLKSEIQTSSSGLIETFTNTATSSTYQSPFNNTSTNYTNDPRFGNQVKLVSEESSVNFGTSYSSRDRSVSLSNPSDPFSITTLTDVYTNGNSEITSVYNGATRTKTTATKLGRTSLVQIDEYERPVKIQKGNIIAQNLTYSEGNLSKITQGTRKTVLSYYGNDLLKSVRNDLGQVTSYTYDNAQRLLTETLPDLRVINYAYDSEGNLKSISPPTRPAHQFFYGANEKLASYKPPATNNGTVNTITNYSYNLDRQLTQINRPDGQNINFNYNTTTGLLDSITGGFGMVNYQYSHERPSYVAYNGLNTTLGYLGDTVSSMILRDGANNTIYTYERTPDSTQGGRVGNETINGGNFNSVPKTIEYSYDDDGYLIGAGDMELQYNTPNGQLEHTKMGSIRDYYYYNSFGEIRAYKAKFQSNEIYSYNLTRDGIGRITQKMEILNGVTKTFDYVYDTVGRLTQVSTDGVITSTYAYDNNSNRVGATVRGETITATYNVQDRMLTYGGETFSANLNGDMTKISSTVNPTPETTEQLFYDPFGNLTSYRFFDGKIDYEIDPFLRRMGRKIDDEVKQRYVYNPEGRLVGELEGTNRLVKTFVYGSKSHVPDYYIDESGNKFRIITDHLGSVRLLVAATSGRVIKMMEHDEFGVVLQDTRPGFLPFGFAGGIYDQYTGLVRFGARDYDPSTGRWTSKDPIRFDAKDPNLYGYVFNDPVNSIDPTGLYQVCTRLTFADGKSIFYCSNTDETKPSGFYEIKDPPCTLLCIFTDKEFKKKQEDDRCKL
ncbi:hypothetical protein DOM21_03670 [Bacteriovorax stolpii]|uniref:RHS repeat domain-containing protein n=1 Tax=Bacteriovorax stolpii TaxID=960 RepID=UPI00115C3343|nr:RHS repeat-associated core domain-containing protein [Bacteriovorax stolpii]QDK40564.1 hypothetical protein DOM21_03670 [Bacteriovorax stolpii]